MARQRKVRWRVRPGRLAVLLAAVAATALLGAMTGYVFAALRGLPDVDPRGLAVEQSSLIYARDCTPDQGDACAPFTEVHGPVDRRPVSLDELPAYVPQAFVAIEDERFYQHGGIDLRGILRALWNNLLPGRPPQGASTITQQLARNLFPIGTERTLRRKIQEAVLAIQLERTYSKEKILELYLNQIYFGRSAYGIEAAARAYFDKSARELTLAEAATLAALVKSPGLYSPDRNPEGLRQRRDLVLTKMAELGFITPEEAARAKEQPLGVKEAPRGTRYRHPWFVDYVIEQLLDHFAAEFQRQGYPPDEAREQAARLVYSGGLRVYATVDLQLQEAAERAAQEVLDRLFPRKGEGPWPEVAIAAVEPASGEILALVGGREHTRALAFNRAVEALRQPGSAIKPLAVYAAAFEAGYTPGTVVDDAPVSYRLADGKAWSPENFDGDYRGLITVREALKRSVNVVAVKVLHDVGIERGFAMARRLGLDTLDDSTADDGKSDLVLPLALGGLTRGVRPLDMAQAYAVFASGGVRSEPYAVREVRDPFGRVLYKQAPRQEAVLSPQLAWLMTDVLRSVLYPHRQGGAGTGAAAAPADRRPAAGKTGTTQNLTDVWFVGYTPDVSAAVWIGYDDARRKLPRGASGGRYAGSVWKRLIDEGLAGRPAREFPRPDGIVEVTICSKDGLLPGPYCPPQFQYTEVFVAGTEPTRVGDVFKPFAVCAEDPKLLYQPGCGCTPQYRVFLDRPPAPPAVDDMALAPPRQTCTAAPLPGQGQQEFQLRIRESDVEPRVLMGAEAGKEVRLTIRAEVPALFRLPDLGVERALVAGETAVVAFTPPAPGWYRFEVDTGRFLIPGRILVKEPATPVPPPGEDQPPPTGPPPGGEGTP